MADVSRRPAPPGSAFAWLGAGLFAASMGWFVFSYFVRFPRLPAGGGSRGIALAWDVALFTLFALHHSVFARDRVRLEVEHTFPGRERSVYVWVASLALIVVCVAWHAVPGVAWTVGGAAAWVLVALRVIGIVLTLYSAAILDIWELAGTQPPRHAPGATGETAVFTRRGPYGWVRHPIYGAWFLTLFAVPVMTLTQLVFALTSCGYLLIGMIFEERSLLRAAPDSYRSYQQQVRWKLIPGVF
jgi:protein-S-isoprenylcysteine O-methyltransferase Ste14